MGPYGVKRLHLFTFQKQAPPLRKSCSDRELALKPSISLSP